jgi:hypothetical protein
VDEITSDSELGDGDRDRMRGSYVTLPRTETRSAAGARVTAAGLEKTSALKGSGTLPPSASGLASDGREDGKSVSKITRSSTKHLTDSAKASVKKKGLEEKMTKLERDLDREYFFDNDDALSSSLTTTISTAASLASTVELNREVEGEGMDVSEDGESIATNTASLPLSEGADIHTESGKRRGREEGTSSSTTPLPPHLNQWRASTLPRSRLSDFIEAMVAERLSSSGYGAAAASVTVRMTSNCEQYMELPHTIVDNLRTSDGLCVPPYLAYRQKCILLFQQVDGVDICLFCLYVQEFDESCPPPNTSKVYIAYLDSVDFFR